MPRAQSQLYKAESTTLPDFSKYQLKKAWLLVNPANNLLKGPAAVKLYHVEPTDSRNYINIWLIVLLIYHFQKCDGFYHLANSAK